MNWRLHPISQNLQFKSRFKGAPFVKKIAK